MLKYYTLLIGENPGYTATFQPSSKRKIALYANCLLIPVILWFINGFLLTRIVLEKGILISILTAIIVSLIIFLIERAIIMSNGNKIIFWFRIALGVIVAFLGSISLDEVIFKNDIDLQMAQYKQAHIDSSLNKVKNEFQSKIARQQSIVTSKGNNWFRSLNDVKGEADGTSGSGIIGIGKNANVKLKIADKQQQDYNEENEKLNALNLSLNREKNIAENRAELDFKDNALLLRIRAMFKLVGKDKLMLIIYLFFTAFLFSLEFLVVLIKVYSKNSVDEDLEKNRNELIKIKTQHIMESGLIYFQPEGFKSKIENANIHMKNVASVL